MKRFFAVALLLISTAAAQTVPSEAPTFAATTKPADAWTPETITKEPTQYLNWIEVQTLNAHDKLKGGQVGVAQSLAALQTMQSQSEQMIAVGDKAVRELAAVYQTTEAANAWPAKWNGRSLDRDQVQTQVVSLHKQIAAKKTLTAKVQLGIQRLQTRQGVIAKVDADAMEELAEVAASRELLKLQAVDEELRDKLIALQPRIAAIGATPLEADAVTIEDLAAQAPPPAKDATFEQILNDYKK